jgi:hypothetical protein
MLYGMMQMQRKMKLENFFKLPNKPTIPDTGKSEGENK